MKESSAQNWSVDDTVNEIRRKGFHWLRSPDEKALSNCLEIAIRLWLFTKPSFEDYSINLNDAIKANLPAQPSPPQTLSAASPWAPETMHRLSEDFSARNLGRKGGFQINWTSQLGDHLTCPNKKCILVFRHARTIQDYQKRPQERSVRVHA